MRRTQVLALAIILLAPAFMGATPTPTPEPTDGTMPEGWTEIAETREIGGRQVALNEAGDAATEIDGVFYPVDARGCYYKEFFDPELQKNDPKIDELTQMVNGGQSPDEITVRYFGSDHIGYLLQSGYYPQYVENNIEGIIYEQVLCHNSLSNEWELVIRYVHPFNAAATPNSSRVMQATVGWLRQDGFESFTYKQQGNDSEKAATVQDAFKLWQGLIDSQERVVVGLPFKLKLNANGTMTDKGYEETLSRLVDEIPKNDPNGTWRNLDDPKFIEWALSQGNQIKYRSDRKNWPNLSGKNKENIWRYWGEQAADGIQPEPVARVVYTQ